MSTSKDEYDDWKSTRRANEHEQERQRTIKLAQQAKYMTLTERCLELFAGFLEGKVHIECFTPDRSSGGKYVNIRLNSKELDKPNEG